MYNPYSLEGKTILITGASSGIGRATAIECSKLGAKLVIHGRNIERLHDTLDFLEGENHILVAGDLTTDQGIETLIEGIPALDGAFFCAGVTDTTPLKFVSDEKIDRVFSINFKAPYLLTQRLVKRKKLNFNASLVYMSSMGAEEITPGLGIYAASKNALNALMKSVAIELVGRKIRSNSIMPMMIKTELVDNISSISEEQLKLDEGKYPFGYGQPSDVAFAAIYLLSDASRWVTGSIIKMDGGSTLV